MADSASSSVPTSEHCNVSVIIQSTLRGTDAAQSLRLTVWIWRCKGRRQSRAQCAISLRGRRDLRLEGESCSYPALGLYANASYALSVRAARAVL